MASGAKQAVSASYQTSCCLDRLLAKTFNKQPSSRKTSLKVSLWAHGPVPNWSYIWYLSGVLGDPVNGEEVPPKLMLPTTLQPLTAVWAASPIHSWLGRASHLLQRQKKTRQKKKKNFLSTTTVASAVAVNVSCYCCYYLLLLLLFFPGLQVSEWVFAFESFTF